MRRSYDIVDEGIGCAWNRYRTAPIRGSGKQPSLFVIASSFVRAKMEEGFEGARQDPVIRCLPLPDFEYSFRLKGNSAAVNGLFFYETNLDLITAFYIDREAKDAITDLQQQQQQQR